MMTTMMRDVLISAAVGVVSLGVGDAPAPGTPAPGVECAVVGEAQVCSLTDGQAAPHDRIQGLDCYVVDGQEYCRLDGSRTVRQIIAATEYRDLPGTREECLIDERHGVYECAEVPMDWPEIVSEHDAREREAMATGDCRRLPDGALVCTEGVTGRGDR